MCECVVQVCETDGIPCKIRVLRLNGRRDLTSDALKLKDKAGQNSKSVGKIFFFFFARDGDKKTQKTEVVFANPALTSLI